MNSSPSTNAIKARPLVSDSIAELIAAGPATELPFDAFEVDALSDPEIDALAHGVIALDARGIVLRYNLAEARLARLDRHSVLGRDFFGEVAPCTRAPEFEGVFRNLVEAGAARSERFPYLFDFHFGAQVCDVEIVKAPNARRYYVFVTRRDFRDARSSLPMGWAAPLQSELDPDRGELDGVLRDRAAQRLLRLDADFLGTFFVTAKEHYPFAWPRLAHDWGVRYGRRWMVSLEMESQETLGEGLAELPLATSLELVRAQLAASGWGRLHVDTSESEEGYLSVELHHSLLAELSGGAMSRSEFGASLLEGLFSAVFTQLAGRPLAAVELPTQTSACSRFLIVAQSLRGFCSTAVQSGRVREPSDLAIAFRTLPGELS